MAARHRRRIAARQLNRSAAPLDSTAVGRLRSLAEDLATARQDAASIADRVTSELTDEFTKHAVIPVLPEDE